LLDASDRVRAVRIAAEHNYNKESREAMYAWMARWLKHAPEDVHPEERAFTPEHLENLLVFYGRALPPNAVDVAGLTNEWIDAAKRQLTSGGSSTFAATLRHVLGFANESNELPANQPPLKLRRSAEASARAEAGSDGEGKTGRNRTVLLGASSPELERGLKAAGFQASVISFTRFDAQAAAKVNHFETYNRTPASQRVADIVAAVRAQPGAVVIADGEAALASILAAAIVPIRLAILDVNGFDASNDQAFVDHVYIPGLRRAGDLATAATMARGEIVVHNAGSAFSVMALHPQAAKLSATDIVALVRKSQSASGR
jgi:hypothetical protein